MRHDRSFVGRGEPAGLTDAPFAGAAVVVRLNSLWLLCRSRHDCHSENITFDSMIYNQVKQIFAEG
jgi:hypothetical protein